MIKRLTAVTTSRSILPSGSRSDDGAAMRIVQEEAQPARVKLNELVQARTAKSSGQHRGQEETGPSHHDQAVDGGHDVPLDLAGAGLQSSIDPSPPAAGATTAPR
jgi:hypothetical protein